MLLLASLLLQVGLPATALELRASPPDHSSGATRAQGRAAAAATISRQQDHNKPDPCRQSLSRVLGSILSAGTDLRMG